MNTTYLKALISFGLASFLAFIIFFYNTTLFVKEPIHTNSIYRQGICVEEVDRNLLEFNIKWEDAPKNLQFKLSQLGFLPCQKNQSIKSWQDLPVAFSIISLENNLFSYHLDIPESDPLIFFKSDLNSMPKNFSYLPTFNYFSYTSWLKNRYYFNPNQDLFLYKNETTSIGKDGTLFTINSHLQTQNPSFLDYSEIISSTPEEKFLKNKITLGIKWSSKPSLWAINTNLEDGTTSKYCLNNWMNSVSEHYAYTYTDKHLVIFENPLYTSSLCLISQKKPLMEHYNWDKTKQLTVYVYDIKNFKLLFKTSLKNEYVRSITKINYSDDNLECYYVSYPKPENFFEFQDSFNQLSGGYFSKLTLKLEEKTKTVLQNTLEKIESLSFATNDYFLALDTSHPTSRGIVKINKNGQVIKRWLKQDLVATFPHVFSFMNQNGLEESLIFSIIYEKDSPKPKAYLLNYHTLEPITHIDLEKAIGYPVKSLAIF